MLHRPLVLRVLLIIVLACTTLLARSTVSADGPQATCRVEACAANCVADVYVLGHGNMNTFSYWYDTAYRLTGCDDPNWWTDFNFLLAIAAEIVGAPSGYIMDCREMAAGQYDVCLSQCQTNPCRYAPNERTTLNPCGQGEVTVTYDNDRGETLVEYEPTAYTRAFSGDVYLTGPSGASLLLAHHDLSTLAYNNWTLWSEAVDTCPDVHGDSRCELLDLFDQPTEASFTIDWGDGLYNLWNNMSAQSGVDSATGDDHVRLLSDGDSVTIAQGPISGYKWEHYRTRVGLGDWGPWQDTVTPWDAAGGDVTITNHEANSWHEWTRVDRDTEVFATRGEPDDLIAGTYTLRATAHLAHDKDVTDNEAVCTMDISAPPPPPPPATATPPTGPTIVDIGPGTTSDFLWNEGDVAIYRLQVPAGLGSVRVLLGGMILSSNFDLKITRGAPAPNGTLVCSGTKGGAAVENCTLNAPAAGTYYIQVSSIWSDGPYTLDITFQTATSTPTATATSRATDTLTPTPTATPTSTATIMATATRTATPSATRTAAPLATATARVTATPAATATARPTATVRPSRTPPPATAAPTALPGGQEETEPNESRQTANTWTPARGPMRGQLLTSNDQDYFQWTADASAIYTVALSDVPSNIPADLLLYYEGQIVASRTDAAPGENVSLTIDANAGDRFVVRVRASNSGQTSTARYQLDLSAVPDPQEPNDLRSTATAWDWRDGPAQGYFFERLGGDADYFAFELSGQETAMLLTVRLDSVSPEVAPDLTLYYGDEIVATKSDAPQGGSIELVIDANPGDTFVARVRPSERSQTSLQPYSLSVSSVPDLNEPDDSLNEAAECPLLTGPASGYFFELVSGDADFYRYTLPASKGSAIVTLQLYNVDAAVAPDLTAFTANRNIIASVTDAPAGSAVSVTFDVNAGETFYARVRPTYRSQVSLNPYLLAADLVGDQQEPNDDIAHATPWDWAAGPVQGYFWEVASGAADYFALSAPEASGMVNMTVTLSDVAPNVAADLTVYSANRTVLASRTDADLGEPVSLDFVATGGQPLYVRVRPTYRSQTSLQPYTLSAVQGAIVEPTPTRTALPTATPRR